MRQPFCMCARRTFLQIIMCLKIQLVYMAGVKQFMSLVTERLSEEFLISLLDLRILMRETKRSLAVKLIQLAAAAARHLTAVVDGLSAAAHAASGTCHNLHKIIAYLAINDILHQLLRITQSADSTSM